jgi:hypothetical protein
VTKGDLDYVFYDFFRGIFNVNVAEGGDLVKASQKNAVSVALLTALVAFRAGHRPDRKDVFGLIATLLALFVLLMLNSRSVLLATAIGFCLIGLLHVLREWRPNPLAVAVLVLLFISVAFAMTLLLYSDSAAVAAIEGRFAFADDSAASRMSQYGWALQRIEGNILWGAGYDELDGQPVHNLLLGALMHAGLPAFLLVLIAYTSLLAFWLGFLQRIVTQPGWWVLPLRPEWVAVLPLTPIIRVWLSGDAGHPGLSEWVSLGMFFGILQTNAMQKVRAGITAPAGAMHATQDQGSPVHD